MTDQIPWPAPGDRLFTETGDDRVLTACVNFGNPEHGYIEGYRRAADSLITEIETTNRNQDYLVYPIVFLYRQYVELQLKEIRSLARHLLDDPTPAKAGHELNPLWAECRDLIEQVWSDAEGLDVVGTCVDEFVALDPGSTAFRYPRDRSGGPSLPQTLRYVDLGNLRSTMAKISSLLGGVDSGLEAHLEAKEEQRTVQAEMRAEYEADMRAEYFEERMGAADDRW